MMGLGANIRSHRKARGWQLWRLSEESGVDVGTLSAIEKRDSKRSQFAVQIAAAFGLTVEQLSSDNVIDSTARRIEESAPNPALPAITTLKPVSERDGWMNELASLAGQLDTLRLGMLIKTARDLVAEQPAKQTLSSTQ